MDPRHLRKPFALLLGALAGAAALAQDYPVRPVRIITSSAGNFHDIVARRLALALAEKWRQPVVVENRPGAGAILAAAAAAQAPADGYTLLVSDRTALAVQPALQRDLPYDPARDLAPITLLGAAPMLFLGQASLPATTLEGFIGYMRASRHPVEFASAGPGTANHLSGELLKQSAHVDLVNVHYKGSPAAMTSLLAGETKAAFMLVPVGLPHVRAGKVRAYATTGRARFPGAPEIPTVAELGMPQLESELWLALMGRAGTPAGVLARINRDAVDALKTPALREALIAQGAEAAYSTPEQLAAFMRAETVKWRKVVELARLPVN